jgi:hypothetical protein
MTHTALELTRPSERIGDPPELTHEEWSEPPLALKHRLMLKRLDDSA